jgi:small-conductance mechanosensitive channel
MLLAINAERIDNIWDTYWAKFLHSLPNLVISVIVVSIAIFLSSQVCRFVGKKLKATAKDPILVPFIVRIIRYALILTGIMFAMEILGFNNIAGSLIAGAGISAFVIGFALKDIGENFLAGIMLALNRPFHIGDTIKIDDYTGDVMELGIRTTKIRTFDGNDVYVPNSMLITNTLTNITASGPTRSNFLISIDYYDDIDKAFEVIVNSIKDVEGLLKNKPPFVNVDQFTTYGVNLKVYYWYNSLEYEKSSFYLQSLIMTKVKNALMQNGFYIPGDVSEMKLYRSEKAINLSVNQVPPKDMDDKAPR